MTDDREASDVNRELTSLLIHAGSNMGLEVKAEYAISGGRIDVVWSWAPPLPIPGVVGTLPIVGFEIESSWRTRKHVKGELLNLQDAGVALGVIVLAGSDPKDDALRRFAMTLVERPGTNIVIWTEEDVRALAGGKERPTAIEAAVVDVTSQSSSMMATYAQASGVEHQGKYRPIWAWLSEQERQQRRVSFSDLERAAGMPLPESCRAHVAHWYSYQGSAVARAIIDAGWRASKVDLNAETLLLSPQ